MFHDLVNFSESLWTLKTWSKTEWNFKIELKEGQGLLFKTICFERCHAEKQELKLKLIYMIESYFLKQKNKQQQKKTVIKDKQS